MRPCPVFKRQVKCRDEHGPEAPLARFCGADLSSLPPVCLQGRGGGSSGPVDDGASAAPEKPLSRFAEARLRERGLL